MINSMPNRSRSVLIALFALWVVVAVGFQSKIDVISTLLLAGPLIVVPIGLVHRDGAVPWWMVVGTLSATFAIVLRAYEQSIALLFAIVWVLATVRYALPLIMRWFAEPARWNLEVLIRTAAPVHLVVASSWLALAVLRRPILGFGVPLVLLTSVHFHMAGFGASLLAHRRLLDSENGSRRERRLAVAGTSLVLAATPTVAVGHLTTGALEFMGALMMCVGVWSLAGASSLQGARTNGWNAKLLVVSALASVAPMLLAVHYGLNRMVTIAPLSYTTIASVHGTLNVFGFLLPGLIATSASKPVLHAERPARSVLV